MVKQMSAKKMIKGIYEMASKIDHAWWQNTTEVYRDTWAICVFTQLDMVTPTKACMPRIRDFYRHVESKYNETRNS